MQYGGIVDTKEVGARIRTYRQKAGLSQEQLAESVGVSFQQVQKYESGFTTLNITKLQQIALALNVSVADFFDAAPSKSEVNLTAEERELLQAYRQVKNGEMRCCILKLVSNLNKRVKWFALSGRLQLLQQVTFIHEIYQLSFLIFTI